MSKSIKPKNDVYLDSSGIVHNKTKLSDILKYSTNEIKVGIWIDGKPIYKKTVEFGSLPNNDDKLVNHNISNIDMIVDYDLIVWNGDSTLALYQTKQEDTKLCVTHIVNKTVCRIITGYDRRSYVGYFTIYYTKTTD